VLNSQYPPNGLENVPPYPISAFITHLVYLEGTKVAVDVEAMTVSRCLVFPPLVAIRFIVSCSYRHLVSSVFWSGKDPNLRPIPKCRNTMLLWFSKPLTKSYQDNSYLKCLLTVLYRQVVTYMTLCDLSRRFLGPVLYMSEFKNRSLRLDLSSNCVGHVSGNMNLLPCYYVYLTQSTSTKCVCFMLSPHTGRCQQ
jgi:hypothetical protein